MGVRERSGGYDKKRTHVAIRLCDTQEELFVGLVRVPTDDFVLTCVTCI